MARRRRWKKKGATQKGGKPKVKFEVFDPHDYESPKQETDNIVITTIDPGRVNCGIYSMSYNTETGKKKSIYLNNLKFEKGEDRVSTIKTFEKLEKERKIFSRSHYILVEEQVIQSIKNIRTGQHIQSYLMTSLRNKGVRPLIVEIGNKMKTEYLGAPYGLPSKGKGSIKEWCKVKGREFLAERNGGEWEDWFIESTIGNKADDKCDCICYCEVWVLLYLEGKLKNYLPVDRRVRVLIED